MMPENAPDPVHEPLDLPVIDGYDRWAEVYDTEDNPLIALETGKILPLLGEVRGRTVADIGCGTCRVALELVAAGARVTGVEQSEGMLARAATKPGFEKLHILRQDITASLALPDDSFDHVTCCLVLDHVTALIPFFRELARICKPAGSVVTSVMHPALLLRGVQARFTDPASGRKIRPRSWPNRISDYLMAMLEARLDLDHISEYAVDQALAARSPNARKYLGWPMLLLLRGRPRA